MLHLPHAGDDENGCLSDCPPQHSLVGAFACLAKPLLTILYTVECIHTLYTVHDVTRFALFNLTYKLEELHCVSKKTGPLLRYEITPTNCA